MLHFRRSAIFLSSHPHQVIKGQNTWSEKQSFYNEILSGKARASEKWTLITAIWTTLAFPRDEAIVWWTLEVSFGTYHDLKFPLWKTDNGVIKNQNKAANFRLALSSENCEKRILISSMWLHFSGPKILFSIPRQISKFKNLSITCCSPRKKLKVLLQWVFFYSFLSIFIFDFLVSWVVVVRVQGYDSELWFWI